MPRRALPLHLLLVPAAAVVAALRARSGAYNVVDDEPLRREAYFGSLASLLGARPPSFPPDWATPLFGAVGQALSRSLRAANGKLRTVTGWAPRDRSARHGWAATLAAMGGH
jgi:nucleoside-diphosphate-sugar epimerase